MKRITSLSDIEIVLVMKNINKDVKLEFDEIVRVSLLRLIGLEIQQHRQSFDVKNTRWI